MGHLYKNSIKLEITKRLVTSWPSMSSTTDEKVLPNTWKEKEEVNMMSEEVMMPTWASLVGLAVSLTNELERVSQRKSSLSSHCWISPSSSSTLTWDMILTLKMITRILKMMTRTVRMITRILRMMTKTLTMMTKTLTMMTKTLAMMKKL